MIGALKGTLIAKQGTDFVIDVGGVGYELSVSGSVFAAAVKLGSPISLIVYTDVRETAISLYGFSDAVEREVFLMLKKVKGIGSRVALNVLSSIGTRGMLSAIGQGDITALTKVPGVGKKTAERVIVELRERVAAFAESPATSLAGTIAVERVGDDRRGLPQGVDADTVLALEKLGFSVESAKKAVQAVRESSEGKTTVDAGSLLRQALAHV